MRRPYVIISLIFLACCFCRVPVSEGFDSHAQRGFHTKKRLVFHLAWNGIPVGSVTAESGEVSVYRGKEIYTVKLVTESNKFLSAIYRVEDKYLSYVAVDTMSSLRYEADRKEGRYRKHVIVEYDFDNAEAIYTSLTDGSVKRCPIQSNPQDPVSAICYFLSSDVRSGESVTLTVNLNEKNYTVYADAFDGKTVKVPAFDARDTFKVDPRVELDGEAYTRGRVWAYVSDDADRFPLYGVIRIPFGTVTAKLVKVEEI